MKSSVSLAIAVAALTIGVPTAAADMGTSGSLDWFERAAAAEVREAGATPYVDAFERPDSASASVAPSAATTRDSGATPYVDAFERPDTAAGASVATSPDWFERSAAAAVREAGATPYVDAFERPVVTGAQGAASSTTESSSSIAWPQLGIGLGLGLALAFGLVMALRHRPGRPLAQ